jgi:hypothetical protein
MSEQQRPAVFVATRFLRNPAFRVAVFSKTYRIADVLAFSAGALLGLLPMLPMALLLPGSMKIAALGAPIGCGAIGWVGFNKTDPDGQRYIERLRPAVAGRAPKVLQASGRKTRSYVGTSPVSGMVPGRVFIARGD